MIYRWKLIKKFCKLLNEWLRSFAIGVSTLENKCAVFINDCFEFCSVLWSLVIVACNLAQFCWQVVTTSDQWGNQVMSDKYAMYTSQKALSVFDLIFDIESRFDIKVENDEVKIARVGDVVALVERLRKEQGKS